MDIEKLKKSEKRQGYTVIDLKNFCREFNLRLGGTKDELVNKLLMKDKCILNEGLGLACEACSKPDDSKEAKPPWNH